jgi:hypothetical protein
MTTVRLPAGTDVAEMALFDVDALPLTLPRDVEGFDPLISQGQLVRLPTGADGGYLLQLFADEAIPVELRRYCLADDTLTGVFATSNGRIGFGGLESAYAQFTPNTNIRSDGVISAGRYTYTAYHTDFPDELVMAAVRVEGTSGERLLGRAPMIAALASAAVSFALLFARQHVLAGAVLVAGIVTGVLLRRLPGYRDIVARREEAQLAFPSIVVELRSSPADHPADKA